MLPQRNIRGLTIAQEAHKPGAVAAAPLNTQSTIKRASHRSTVSGSTTSSNSSLSLPTDASGSESTLSSPSLPSSAFSSSAGSTSYAAGGSRGAAGASSHQTYQNKLAEQLANLEIGVEFKLDLRAEDIEAVTELGHGNGGTVTKVRHIPTGAIMARKVLIKTTLPAILNCADVARLSFDKTCHRYFGSIDRLYTLMRSHLCGNKS